MDSATTYKDFLLVIASTEALVKFIEILKSNDLQEIVADTQKLNESADALKAATAANRP